jgi:hypothetical protein
MDERAAVSSMRTPLTHAFHMRIGGPPPFAVGYTLGLPGARRHGPWQTEVLELPEEVLVLRMPVAGLEEHPTARGV